MGWIDNLEDIGYPSVIRDDLLRQMLAKGSYVNLYIVLSAPGLLKIPAMER